MKDISPRSQQRRKRKLHVIAVASTFGLSWCCLALPYLFWNMHATQTIPAMLPIQRTLNVTETKSLDQIPDTAEPALPHWLTDYTDWHAAELKKLNRRNWNKHKFLVMRCLQVDDRCGGAADRLKSIPAALRLAHQLERIFFIKWERPARLEEFLLPSGPLNWTIPYWLDPKFHFENHPTIIQERKFAWAANLTTPLIHMRYQSADHGASYYNMHRDSANEPDFEKAYAAIWKHVFKPSTPVQALIDKELRQLQSNDFVAVHVRAKYRKDRSTHPGLVSNAVNCGSQLGPGLPIYVAADSVHVNSLAEEYARRIGAHVVALDSNETLHLDRGTDFFTAAGKEIEIKHPPSSYYNAFVDLYMIAKSRCVAINKGGFGRWSHLMSGRPKCLVNHGKTKCEYISKV